MIPKEMHEETEIARYLPLEGFYHFGYVTKDLDSALRTLSTTFGMVHSRRKFNAPWMEVIHAQTGTTQIEVARFTSEAPKMYLDFVPEYPGEIRLQHLGYLVKSLEKWEGLQNAIKQSGLSTPLDVEMMDGHLRAIFVDTRSINGLYMEYLFFSGPALLLNKDVPNFR